MQLDLGPPSGRSVELMSPLQTTVVQSFATRISSLLDKSLHFAFIAGSFASGKARPESDIDMFVCVDERDAAREKSVHKLYNGIHRSTGFRPDLEYGCEIMTLDELVHAIDHTARQTPSRQLSDRLTWDGIVWSGMLTAPVIGVAGDRTLKRSIRRQARRVVRTWASAIGGQIRKLDIVSRHAENAPGFAGSISLDAMFRRRSVLALTRPDLLKEFITYESGI